MSLPFLLDLTSWRIADYESQWRGAIDRLVRGTPATALMTGFSKDAAKSQAMWALWRDGDYLYVQPHAVVPDELDVPFDPFFPEPHVGTRLAAEYGLPISEWRIELVHVIADAFGLRLPLFPR